MTESQIGNSLETAEAVEYAIGVLETYPADGQPARSLNKLK
jgi:hypothetical protein